MICNMHHILHYQKILIALVQDSLNLSFSDLCFLDSRLAHVTSLSQFRSSAFPSSLTLFQTLTKWTPTTLSGTKYGYNRHLTPDPNHVAHGSTPGPPCLCSRYCLRTESWWPTRGKSFVIDWMIKAERYDYYSISIQGSRLKFVVISKKGTNASMG